jgi:hypothetical protein
MTVGKDSKITVALAMALAGAVWFLSAKSSQVDANSAAIENHAEMVGRDISEIKETVKIIDEKLDRMNVKLTEITK